MRSKIWGMEVKVKSERECVRACVYVYVCVCVCAISYLGGLQIFEQSSAYAIMRGEREREYSRSSSRKNKPCDTTVQCTCTHTTKGQLQILLATEM